MKGKIRYGLSGGGKRCVIVETPGGHVDYPILRPDGRVAFDFPARISIKLREQAERAVIALEKEGRTT